MATTNRGLLGGQEFQLGERKSHVPQVNDRDAEEIRELRHAVVMGVIHTMRGEKEDDGLNGDRRNIFNVGMKLLMRQPMPQSSNIKLRAPAARS